MVDIRRSRRAWFNLFYSFRLVEGAVVSVADRNEDTFRNGQFFAVDLENCARLETGLSVTGATAADGRTGAARTMRKSVASATGIRHEDRPSREAGQGGMGGNSNSDS